MMRWCIMQASNMQVYNTQELVRRDKIVKGVARFSGGYKARRLTIKKEWDIQLRSIQLVLFSFINKSHPKHRDLGKRDQLLHNCITKSNFFAAPIEGSCFKLTCITDSNNVAATVTQLLHQRPHLQPGSTTSLFFCCVVYLTNWLLSWFTCYEM